MLTIRQAQLEVFRQQMDRALIDRLTLLLQEEFSDRFTDPAGPRKQAEFTVRKASKASIESDDCVVELARMMMLYGNDLETFADPDWAAGILSHAALPGDLKIELLRDRLNPRVESSDEEV